MCSVSVPSECECTPNAFECCSSAKCKDYYLCSRVQSFQCFVLSSRLLTRVGAPGVWSLHLISDRHFIESITILSLLLSCHSTERPFVCWFASHRTHSLVLEDSIAISHLPVHSKLPLQVQSGNCLKSARVVRNWLTRGMTARCQDSELTQDCTELENCLCCLSGCWERSRAPRNTTICSGLSHSVSFTPLQLQFIQSLLLVSKIGLKRKTYVS